MTQVSKYIGSEMWSRPIAAAESSSGLYLCLLLFDTQARWSSQINLSTSSSWLENKSLLADRQYGHKVDSGQKLLQYAFF
jgi:hypothetical protein